MSEIVLIAIGVLVGIAGDEAYRAGKSQFLGWRARRFSKHFVRAANPVLHAKNVIEIFTRRGLDSALYRTTTVPWNTPIPVVNDPETRWAGEIDPRMDAPLRLVSHYRHEFPVDTSIIQEKKRAGLKLWDGSILYSLNKGPATEELPVGVCNYFAYVDLGERVLRESSSISGPKPVLAGPLCTFDDAVSGAIRPVVLAAAAACVFETGTDRVVAVQRRSEQVVNARGLVGLAPIFGLEPNAIGSQHSEFGLLAYNLLKEILEEFFGQEEAERIGDLPSAPHPDYIFQTSHGQRLLSELDNGHVRIFCTGSAIDLTDGSLVLSLLVHFTSPTYYEMLRYSAVGSWEAESQRGPRIEFRSFDASETEDLMSVGTMIPTSIYALDRARAHLNVVAPTDEPA